MKNNLLLSLLIIVYASSLSGQQLSSWSSFYENGFVWNPALSAQFDNREIALTNRSEWSGFEDAPEFGTLSYQSPLTRLDKNAAFGAFLEYDKAGPLQNIGLSGTYAYKIKPLLLNNENDLLSFGFLVKIQQLRLNELELEHPDLSFGGNSELPSSSSFQPNVGVGLHYMSSKDAMSNRYYFGFSMLNIIPSNFNTSIEEISISNTMHLTSNLGYSKFLSSSDAILDFNLLGIYAFTRPFDLMLNIRYEKINKYWISGGLVNTGEFFGQFGVIVGKKSDNKDAPNNLFRLGIKADYSFGSISRVAGLGYEFYIAYRLGSVRKKITDKGYRPSKIY
jgi:type IX secretion system PorP/SprF family membrane protein